VGSKTLLGYTHDCLCLYLGANIFLTLKGSVKLGDFGCSIKLKSHTTLPGELMANAGGVGTPGQLQFFALICK